MSPTKLKSSSKSPGYTSASLVQLHSPEGFGGQNDLLLGFEPLGYGFYGYGIGRLGRTPKKKLTSLKP